MARYTPRVQKHVVWSPTSNKPAVVANSRVCLALLRIYRAVAFDRNDLDFGEVVRPLWPLIRLETVLLRDALQDWHSRQTKAHVTRGSSRFLDLPAWAASKGIRGPKPPEAAPESEILCALGDAMVSDWPGFRLLFDAVEQDLEQLVARRRSVADRNVELLSNLLQLSSTEQGVLSLCAALEVSTVGSRAFAAISRPARQVQALQVSLQAPSEQVVRNTYTSDSALSRSGLMYRDLGTQSDLEDTLRLSRQGSALMGANVRSATDMSAIVLKVQPQPRETVALVWPHLDDRRDLLAKLLANALRNRALGVNVLLYGAPGTGKSEFAKYLVDQAGARGYRELLFLALVSSMRIAVASS